LGHLTDLHVMLLRMENCAELWPPFARQMPLNVPESHFHHHPPSFQTNSSTAPPSTMAHFDGMSHHSAKVSDAPFVPADGIAFTEECNPEASNAYVADTCDGVATDRQDGPLPSTTTRAEQAAAYAPDPAAAAAAPSVADVSAHHHHHEPIFADTMETQWKEIVDLVRECWNLELEARPSAASLQARAGASVDSLVYTL
jgi:hypothetical protein